MRTRFIQQEIRYILALSLFAAAALLAGRTRVEAQIVNLVDGNSIAQVDTGSQAGMFNWTVDGAGQLFQQWFWYRVGNASGESSIDSISPPLIVTPDGRTLNVTYTSPLFSIRVDYLLTGGTAGSGISQVNESITIRNLTQGLLDFHFFQYSDFDLGSTSGGDTVQLGKNLAGKFNEAVQFELPLSFSETAITPGADHGEVGIFPTIITKLNDGLPTTLNDSVGPLGPDDVNWAFQWDTVLGPMGNEDPLAPRDSFVISKVKYLQVPEPSSITLSVLAFSVLGVLRMRRAPRA